MNITSNNHHHTSPHPNNRNPEGSPSVLIVDDDPRVGDVLLELLQSEGFIATYAKSGFEALHKIEKNPPTMVLVDMRMPVMDGVTLLREITQRWDKVEVIMMSATESPAGLPVPFIQKPFDLDEVVSVVCDYIPKA